MLIFKRALIFLLVINMAGCAVNRASGELMAGSSIPMDVPYYVVTEEVEKRETDQLIAEALLSRGLAASAGPADEAPTDTGVIVQYDDKWMWDITMYMLELTITLADPKDEFPIATGNSYHTSLSRLDAEQMVDEVLTNIFAAE